MSLPDDNSSAVPDAKPIHYLTVSDLFNINMTVTNGDTYVRDMNLLGFAVARPALSFFGQPMYPTLLEKAAALLDSMANHHLFADGNKRTAVQAVTYFLDLNGYEITWDFASEYPFILEVAQGKQEFAAIVLWLEQYIRPSGRALCSFDD